MRDYFGLFTNSIVKSPISYTVTFVWNFCTALPWTQPKQRETAECLETNYYLFMWMFNVWTNSEINEGRTKEFYEISIFNGNDEGKGKEARKKGNYNKFILKISKLCKNCLCT